MSCRLGVEDRDVHRVLYDCQPDWGQRWQPHQQHRVIVCRDPVRIVLTAPEAFMDEHLLAVASGEHPVWLHQRMTIALAVAGRRVVHMPRVETVRAVVPVPATGRRCANKLLAFSAFERLVAFRAGRARQPRPLACGRRRASLRTPLAIGPFVESEIISGQVEIVFPIEVAIVQW